jgi:hypothetical protein
MSLHTCEFCDFWSLKKFAAVYLQEQFRIKVKFFVKAVLGWLKNNIGRLGIIWFLLRRWRTTQLLKMTSTSGQGRKRQRETSGPSTQGETKRKPGHLLFHNFCHCMDLFNKMYSVTRGFLGRVRLGQASGKRVWGLRQIGRVREVPSFILFYSCKSRC